MIGYAFNEDTKQNDHFSATQRWAELNGTQVTVSEGHPFRSVPRPSGDVGGDFSSTKSYVSSGDESKALSRTQFAGKSYRLYHGPITPINPAGLQFPPIIASSNADLDELGATAVARCKPTNSVADASVFLGELYKDGLPHLIGSSTWKDRTGRIKDLAKGLSDDFLNIQFGWQPLVSDVKKFSYAVSHADTVLKQYERDAGKVVRRHYSFPVQTVTEEPIQVDSGGIPSYFVPQESQLLDGVGGKCYKVVETTRRQWFSGAFTYHLPSGLDSRSTMGRHALYAKKLLGLSLTPETLWNLAPWSWAADWFSNTGDVVSNISDWATDGLVMHYGYIMEHSICKHIYSRTPSGIYGHDGSVSPLILVTETKLRRRANPFGFGVTWDGLSPIQTLIAAAIGLKRS